MKINCLKLNVCAALVSAMACMTGGCSKKNSNADSVVTGPTELEKNTHFFKILEGPLGVRNLVWGPNNELGSLIVSASQTLRGKPFRNGLEASQQAAIWSACGKLLAWRKSHVNLGEKGSVESESTGELDGIQVLYFKTDLHNGEVTAILAWKARPSNSEIGTLPKMAITTHSTSSVATDKSKNTSSEETRKIYINGILVINEVMRTSMGENGEGESTTEYQQFFENGKPRLEETAERKKDSVKIRGITWDEAGKKTTY
jgi:hypothetical protein